MQLLALPLLLPLTQSRLQLTALSLPLLLLPLPHLCGILPGVAGPCAARLLQDITWRWREERVCISVVNTHTCSVCMPVGVAGAVAAGLLQNVAWGMGTDQVCISGVNTHAARVCPCVSLTRARRASCSTSPMGRGEEGTSVCVRVVNTHATRVPGVTWLVSVLHPGLQ